MLWCGKWQFWITSIKFKTHIVDKVTVYRVKLEWHNIEESSDAWFGILKEAPRDLMMFLRFTKSGEQKILSSFGQFFGTPERLQEILAPLLKFATIEPIEIKELDYMTAIKYWGGTPFSPQYFKASSIFLTSPLPKAALKVIEQFLSNPQIKDAFVVIDSYGGAIKDTKRDSTAFIHRDKIASV